MAIRVRKNLRSLETLIGRVNKSFGKNIRRELTDVIKEEILSGKSPVKGKRFKDYSDSYSKLKGRKKPVDMFVTGTMLESLKARLRGRSSVLFFFSSEIAVYHDKLGAGINKVIRRLLPTRQGEEFKTKINNKILKITDTVVNKETKK